MIPVFTILIPFILSLFLVGWIHSKIVTIAKMKNIVDNPDARKLQRMPVPVLGGVAVFFGVMIGLGVMTFFLDNPSMLMVVVAMMVMLYTGTMDDILNLSPSLRFLIEIFVVVMLMLGSHGSIDDFHGLWGLNAISLYVAYPLTVFAAVGIINAINLIDGVNGLSSGFCIMACVMFGTFFYLSGNVAMTVLAASATGALIPFFLHNVFGKTSKMFIGDGGTLVMGVIMSVFVISALRHDSTCAAHVGPNVGLVPFTLAVLCVPVFDTLRVMSTRILKGTSPFHPDKTHLHHMFISLGCSHFATTVAILSLNLGVVLLWWLMVALDASIDLQLYVVIGVSVLITFVLYHFMTYQREHDTKVMSLIRRLGYHLHISRTRSFFVLQKFMDRI